MSFRKKFGIHPGDKIKLAKLDTGRPTDYTDKNELLEKTSGHIAKLAELQYKMYAENRRSVLVVLQALDAGGKDGVINHVFSGLNLQGCRVRNFKTPGPLEAAHDFLWRIHLECPQKGELVVFNRSHYEDVLFTRVHGLISHEIWSKRFDYINDFERYLVGNDITVVKFFLHISPAEQLERLAARLDEPDKHWKISDSDLEERRYWNDYEEAFEDIFAKCSTPEAPWYIIPSDSKSFRNYAVSKIMLEIMEDMEIQTPAPTADIESIRQKMQAELRKYGK